METSVDANKSDGEILQQDPETKQMVVDEEIASCSRNIGKFEPRLRGKLFLLIS